MLPLTEAFAARFVAPGEEVENLGDLELRRQCAWHGAQAQHGGQMSATAFDFGQHQRRDDV